MTLSRIIRKMSYSYVTIYKFPLNRSRLGDLWVTIRQRRHMGQYGWWVTQPSDSRTLRHSRIVLYYPTVQGGCISGASEPACQHIRLFLTISYTFLNTFIGICYPHSFLFTNSKYKTVKEETSEYDSNQYWTDTRLFEKEMVFSVSYSVLPHDLNWPHPTHRSINMRVKMQYSCECIITLMNRYKYTFFLLITLS